MIGMAFFTLFNIFCTELAALAATSNIDCYHRLLEASGIFGDWAFNDVSSQ